jgi:REP element-mobilizing transposase RayT
MGEHLPFQIHPQKLKIMANTYSNLYVHVVFAVKFREAMIKEEYRERLQKFITGIVTNRRSKVLAIYCMPDHVYLLVGLNPAVALSDLTGLNERRVALPEHYFAW